MSTQPANANEEPTDLKIIEHLKSLPDDALITWKDGIRHLYPVSKNTWIAGWKAGRYPKPIKMGPRLNGWRIGTIRQFLANLAQGQEQ